MKMAGLLPLKVYPNTLNRYLVIIALEENEIIISFIIHFSQYCFVGATPTAHPPCIDVINTCSQYGKSVCTAYRGWAATNCRKYCDLCRKYQMFAYFQFVKNLTLLHSEQSKLHRVLAVLSAIRLNLYRGPSL